MKNILFYMGGYDHPFFREQFNCQGETFVFIPDHDSLAETEIKRNLLETNTLKFKIKAHLKELLLKLFRFVGIPQFRVKFASDEIDKIYSRFPLITNKPYILEIEDVSILFWYRKTILHKKSARFIMKYFLQSDKCEAILPWTQASYNSIKAIYGENEKIMSKTKVLYPAIKPKIDEVHIKNKAKKEGKIEVLFVGPGYPGIGFFAKGGYDLLKAFSTMENDNMNLTIVSGVPQNIQDEYKADNILFKKNIPQKEIVSLFMNSDIFVLPTYMDTFGFAMLEAMSYGIPVITTDNFAAPEIVMDGKTGIVIKHAKSYYKDFLPAFLPMRDQKHPFVKKLMNDEDNYMIESLQKAMQTLAMDKGKRVDFGLKGLVEAVNGRFSCHQRQKKLSPIL